MCVCGGTKEQCRSIPCYISYSFYLAQSLSRSISYSPIRFPLSLSVSLFHCELPQKNKWIHLAIHLTISLGPRFSKTSNYEMKC